MELGTVRVRVGLSYDPLRLSPSSGDLYYRKLRGPFLQEKTPRTPHTHQTIKNNSPNKTNQKLLTTKLQGDTFRRRKTTWRKSTFSGRLSFAKGVQILVTTYQYKINKTNQARYYREGQQGHGKILTTETQGDVSDTFQKFKTRWRNLVVKIDFFRSAIDSKRKSDLIEIWPRKNN